MTKDQRSDLDSIISTLITVKIAHERSVRDVEVAENKLSNYLYKLVSETKNEISK